MDAETDLLARNAAAIYMSGHKDKMTIQRAINIAVERSPQSVHLSVSPKVSDVRKHIQAMTLETIGDAAYTDQQTHILETAEELMTVLEEHEPILAGRAAKLQFDGDVNLPVRIYTNGKVDAIVTLLEQYEYPVAEFRYDAINTRFGRLSRIQFKEDIGASVTITLCRPEMRKDASRNLFRDEAVATLTLAQVRKRLGGGK